MNPKPLPRQQLNDIRPNVSCKIPLCGTDECQSKKCENVTVHIPKHYHVPEERFLEETDQYWTEFLKAQQISSANYLYHMQIYGNNKDPTLERRDPFPPELVHQRLLHMPIIGDLDKNDLYYLLSFILNLLRLKQNKQDEYLESFHNLGLLDNELLNYMQIIARHPNAGIPRHIQNHFLEFTQYLLNKSSSVCQVNFFNPDHIFIKSMVEMDPYELAYLKDIMETGGNLNRHQFMYLVNFVERLQEMPLSRRDKYLKTLYDRRVLPSPTFQHLVLFIKKKSIKFNRPKLINLWNKLVTLLDIGRCFPQPEKPPIDMSRCFQPVESRVTQIDIDAYQVQKALRDLMKGGIPNIIRLKDLKKFVVDLMQLGADQLEQVLNQMKNTSLLSMDQLRFLQTFVAKEKLNGDEEQKNLLLQKLQKVGSTPPNETPSVVLAIPATKGPYPPPPPIEKEDVEKAVEPFSRLEAGTEKTTKENQKKAEKEKKSNRKGGKKPKRKLKKSKSKK